MEEIDTYTSTFAPIFGSFSYSSSKACRAAARTYAGVYFLVDLLTDTLF